MNNNDQFYLVVGEDPTGPHTRQAIAQMLASREIDHDFFCCPLGDSQWGTVREFFPPEPEPEERSNAFRKMNTVKLQLPARTR